MNRKQYLRAVIDLYLEAPGSPPRATRADWAIAANLYRSLAPLEHIAHAIRLATLRRTLSGDTPARISQIRSLAYYRTVLRRLAPHELEIGYVDYVQSAYLNLRTHHESQPLEAKTAVSPPENRSF